MTELASQSLRELGIENIKPDEQEAIAFMLTQFGSMQARKWFSKLALVDTQMLAEGRVFLYPNSNSARFSDPNNYQYWLEARDMENTAALFPSWLPWWVQASDSTTT